MKIVHSVTRELIAEGKRGWAIMPFEGNFYVSAKALKTDNFKMNYVPGVCIYKFLYVWLDFRRADGEIDKYLGWRYWLPNPLLPFIWFRVAVPQNHPMLVVLDDD